MFYQLPPVGNAIRLSNDAQSPASLNRYFSPYQARYYASGTAALAAAISVALQLKHTDNPEVILPAYGCPDLVSAALFAGVKPVLVDLKPDRPWMSLDALSSSISARTVAIIAVSLFGISERIAELRPIAEQAGVVLIEDSAQAFPHGHETDFWQAELVVLSFGRGKPVSMLGGGAVLYRGSGLAGYLPTGAEPGAGIRSRQLRDRLKTQLYNLMISPWLYWLPQNVPFLHLGETRYHPLADIEAIDSARLGTLAANIAAYQQHDLVVQDTLAAMLEGCCSVSSKLKDLPRLCSLSPQRRLLRYPLLVDATVRDTLYRKLLNAGLGPSVMYPATLPAIPGLQKLLAGQGPFPVAEMFAANILTLPTHGGVRVRDIAKMRKLLESVR